jgi:hypothetical protein
LAGALILLICQRVRRVEGRIVRMLARFQAGRLRVSATTRVGGGSLAGTRVVGGAAQLPRGFAWLLPLVPCAAANYAAQLRITLATPEMVALLAAAPQARRVLGPLCRMLGIEASVLGAAVAGPADGVVSDGVKAVTPRERTMPVRKTRTPADWGRIPLPRGVLAAARRDRSLKG